MMDMVARYSAFSDDALLMLSKERSNLTEEATSALDSELLKRGLLSSLLREIRQRAYETPMGIVVTDETIRIPNVCPRCLARPVNIPISIRSADSKPAFWLVFTKIKWKTYEFLFCDPCASALRLSGGSSSGVWFESVTSTPYSRFHFSDQEYKEMFLIANR